jgi:ABC-type multidrug transport system ATPase subunit
MIVARDLGKRYGRTLVLDGLSFDVARGERLAVLGVNGAGKTTLFRCLLGLTAFEGTLSIAGHRAGPEGIEARRRIGWVPQLPPVFDLSLEAFLDLVCDLRVVPRVRAAERLVELGLPLEAAGAKPLGELSGGMLQKAYLALALAAETPVLLLDEPTASLDPGSRREFLRLLSRIDPGTTVLLASHRLEEIEPLTRRLIVLHEGRIAFDGDLAELRQATGADVRLWIGTPEDERERAAAALAAMPFVRAVSPNGAGVHVEAAADSHLRVLRGLEALGLRVSEFRTRAPALEDILERLVDRATEERGPSRRNP